MAAWRASPTVAQRVSLLVASMADRREFWTAAMLVAMSAVTKVVWWGLYLVDLTDQMRVEKKAVHSAHSKVETTVAMKVVKWAAWMDQHSAVSMADRLVWKKVDY